MIVTSDLAGPGSHPPRGEGQRLIASVDVEWTKNYKVRDGNRAFCYSVSWLTIPGHADPYDLAAATFSYTSAYLARDDEPPRLIEAVAADLDTALREADLLVGHQLCSDLAVLAANALPSVPPAIERAQRAWRDRHGAVPARVLDTRFDTDTVLTGRSRRLVDVCEELHLQVKQPELARASMTALHRAWLASEDIEARERVTVLNLRHSLSTALVAARAVGWGRWDRELNVNRLLHGQLSGRFGWLAGPVFQGLL